MRQRDDLRALEAALRTARPATSGTALATFIDVEQAFRSWAVDAVVGHWDGYWFGNNNYYVYSHPDGRFRMIPHGMDWLFSENWPDYDPRANQDPFRRVGDSPAGSGSSAFSRLAEADVQGRERYKQALAWVVQNAFDVPGLTAEIKLRAKAFDAWPKNEGGARVSNDIESFRVRLPGVLDLLDKRKTFLKTKL
jgi:spore coat protein CotH